MPRLLAFRSMPARANMVTGRFDSRYHPIVVVDAIVCNISANINDRAVARGLC